MGKKRGITRAFLGVAASNDISHNPVVPGGASVAVSWTFLKGFFLSFCRNGWHMSGPNSLVR